MASIAWTDATGAASLANGKTGPGARFRGWRPLPEYVGPKHHALGTGVRYAFAFRTDYMATFRLEAIPRANQSLLDRLRLHLDGGGTISITTGDASGNIYATCGLAEGAPLPEPEWDAQLAEFAITLTVVNLAATPVPLLCVY